MHLHLGFPVSVLLLFDLVLEVSVLGFFHGLEESGFNFKLIWVLALLGTAIAMFIKNRPRMDAVGVIMIAALPFTGIISVEETLVGFSDPNIVLIAVLFVLGEGLVRTGVARDLGDWINVKAGGNETKLLILLMVQ